MKKKYRIKPARTRPLDRTAVAAKNIETPKNSKATPRHDVIFFRLCSIPSSKHSMPKKEKQANALSVYTASGQFIY